MKRILLISVALCITGLAAMYMIRADIAPSFSRTATVCFEEDVLTQVWDSDLKTRKYMLFLRQSGFQEKEFFYELYPETVEFNVCNVGNVEPLDKVHVDTSQGAVDYVAIEAGRLTITYKPSSSGVDDSLANPAVESAPQ